MPKEQLYNKYARFYDKIYSQKDYEQEIDFVNTMAHRYKVPGAKLLDMACGTGTHAKRFAEHGYHVTGVDIHPEMLKRARQKTRKARFRKSSMQSFFSEKGFDIITCFFTSINYNKSISELRSTLSNFYGLLNKGGIAIFDLGLTRGGENISMDTYSGKNLQVGRVAQWGPSGKHHKKVQFLTFKKEKGSVDFDIDEHDLGVFSVQDARTVLKESGFSVTVFDGFTLKRHSKRSGRPVFVGKK